MGTRSTRETLSKRSRSPALPSIPTGLITRAPSDDPSSGPGPNAKGAAASAAPMRTSQATGRQRGDGSLPSGKNKKTKRINDPPAIQTQEVSHALTTLPGKVPGLVASV